MPATRGSGGTKWVSAARPGDMPFIRECVERFRLDDERLEPKQFVVIRRNGRIVAFGRIKPYGSDGGDVYELGGVGVLESERGKGLGAAIVNELIRRFPVPDVWITTDLPAWFERFGFRRDDAAPAPLREKLARVCCELRPGTVAMVLRRPARRRSSTQSRRRTGPPSA